ncbi:hypothetical protein ACWXVL_02890 [Mycoplasma sp. 128]
MDIDPLPQVAQLKIDWAAKVAEFESVNKNDLTALQEYEKQLWKVQYRAQILNQLTIIRNYNSFIDFTRWEFIDSQDSERFKYLSSDLPTLRKVSEKVQSNLQRYYQKYQDLLKTGKFEFDDPVEGAPLYYQFPELRNDYASEERKLSHNQVIARNDDNLLTYWYFGYIQNKLNSKAYEVFYNYGQVKKILTSDNNNLMTQDQRNNLIANFVNKLKNTIMPNIKIDRVHFNSLDIMNNNLVENLYANISSISDVLSIITKYGEILNRVDNYVQLINSLNTLESDYNAYKQNQITDSNVRQYFDNLSSAPQFSTITQKWFALAKEAKIDKIKQLIHSIDFSLDNNKEIISKIDDVNRKIGDILENEDLKNIYYNGTSSTDYYILGSMISSSLGSLGDSPKYNETNNLIEKLAPSFNKTHFMTLTNDIKFFFLRPFELNTYLGANKIVQIMTEYNKKCQEIEDEVTQILKQEEQS